MLLGDKVRLLAESAQDRRRTWTENNRKVIDSVARKALSLPPEARLAFIKAEIVKVRGDFLRTYEAEPRLAASAGELVDGIDSQVKARLTIFETKGHSGTAWPSSTAS